VVNGRDLLFGGGSPTVTSAVQDDTRGHPGGDPPPAAATRGPRRDQRRHHGYVLGGFDSSQGSTMILPAGDGMTFTVAGALPVSVRYPAVAFNGGSIWLFGGEHASQQVTDVQRIDVATGQGSVAGRLPRSLAHAGAFTLGVRSSSRGRSRATTTDTVMRFDPATMRLRPLVSRRPVRLRYRGEYRHRLPGGGGEPRARGHSDRGPCPGWWNTLTGHHRR
jgi:hypothetical protein